MQPPGLRVRLRDAGTLDDLGELTAPAPVEPGDLVATVDVEVVFATPPDARWVPALVVEVDHE